MATGIMKKNATPGLWSSLRPLCTSLSVLLLLMAGGSALAAPSGTVESQYPGLASGILKSARLESLEKDFLLVTDGIRIKTADLMAAIKGQDPKVHQQLTKNLFFVLKEETTRKVLNAEARKVGISLTDGDDSRAMKELFDRKSAGVSVSEKEARDFYQANRKMVGDAPFEQLQDGIRQYLLQGKKQQAAVAYVASLQASLDLRVNRDWVKAQSLQAADNAVDRARKSGKPTMVEFGASGCVPCDMMQPILDKLRKTFPEKLNIVFVHVGEEQILAARHAIQAIPVQVFIDAAGKEVFRHEGFFPENEVMKRLEAMGVRK